MKTALGIDIGGTKISMVLGTAAGKILARSRIPTLKNKEVPACIHEMIRCLRQLISENTTSCRNLIGIGLGIPGAVDSSKGVVPRSPHLPGWEGMLLSRILEKEFGIPVIMANDANAACVAEKIFGSAKECQNYIYVTVSTGIGGGIITHGRLLEGASYVAGEVGHMTIVPDGNKCKCGNNGCLEAYASGTAIAKHAEVLVAGGRKSVLRAILKRQGYLSGADVGNAALEQDSVAEESFAYAAHFLGVGLANLLNIVNPELITLGGGVWRSAPPFFFDLMIASCKKYAWPEAFDRVHIMKSKLGNSVGDLGALALVFENVGLSNSVKPVLKHAKTRRSLVPPRQFIYKTGMKPRSARAANL